MSWNNTQQIIYNFQPSNEETLFPRTYGAPGQILHAIRTSPIALVDNAPKGTQLKLLLLLEVSIFRKTRKDYTLSDYQYYHVLLW